MDEQILELLQKMNGRLDRMDERFDKMELRFDKLEVLITGSAQQYEETNKARVKDVEELKKRLVTVESHLYRMDSN